MPETMVPIVLFLTIGAVIMLNFYFRYRTRQAIQLTVRTAIEQGQQLTPDVLEGLTSRNGDLRRGIISITIGVAIAAFGLLLGEEDAVGPLTAISAFPILIGLAYLGLWFFLKRKQD